MTGSNFTSVSGITFGSNSQSFVVNSDTDITITVDGLGSSGTVRVYNEYGNTASLDTFSYIG
jgi:hypothetical protein